MLNKTRFAFAFRNSPVWLEGKGQELNVETTQLSARRDLILQSVLDVLHKNGIHRLKGEIMVVLLAPVSSQPFPETALSLAAQAALEMARGWQQGGQAELTVHLCCVSGVQWHRGTLSGRPCPISGKTWSPPLALR